MSRTAASDRLGRLLAIVPWIAERDGPTVDEVCTRFGLTEAQLRSDLDLLFLCGVHPFTPDTLIEVDVADGRVWIRYADYFRRPLRLTPQEGLALVGAGATLLAVPGADGDGALARALAKVETVLGVASSATVEVELAPVAGDVLDTLRRAVDDRQRLEVDYYTFGRDETTTRVIRPRRVFNSAGQWYVAAWCERVEADRMFRVDRIGGLRPTGTTFERPVGAPVTDTVWEPAPSDPVVVLDLAPAAHWVAGQYPNEGVEARPGDVLRVTLRASAGAWLERLLLRAGPDATVVSGEADGGARAAARILVRYDAGREPGTAPVG